MKTRWSWCGTIFLQSLNTMMSGPCWCAMTTSPFEFLILKGAQAGLSEITIHRKFANTSADAERAAFSWQSIIEKYN